MSIAFPPGVRPGKAHDLSPSAQPSTYGFGTPSEPGRTPISDDPAYEQAEAVEGVNLTYESGESGALRHLLPEAQPSCHSSRGHDSAPPLRA